MSTSFSYGVPPHASGCACEREACDGCAIYETHKPRRTNVGRLRALSVEDMAVEFAHFAECSFCPARRDSCERDELHCKSAWMDWLNQEVGCFSWR